MGSIFEIFAVCPPGLEDLLAREIEGLGLPTRKEIGGCALRGGLRELYLLNLWSRISNRVLLKVGSFKATTFRELVERASRYPWEVYFAHASGVRIRVTCRRSKLYHSDAVAERIVRAISQRLGREIYLSKDEKAPLLIVRIFRDEVLLRVDSSGGDLFRRGYKVARGPAPLRENLAAALVMLSGWDQKAPFFDPFCGTGTILIEALWIAMNRAPGLGRSFAFEQWKNFSAPLWEELCREAEKAMREPQARFYGSDRDPKAVQATFQNAEAAGVARYLDLEIKEVAHILPPDKEPGFVVTNPPFGGRLQMALKPLRELASRFKGPLREWQLTFIFPRRRLPVRFPFPLEVLTSFEHGGQKVFVFRRQTASQG
ncbi:MAG: class I SAM-dependent RNA methyltransferase [Thermodesulfobacteria bacterium]|nr:class I SAM-dependent RNA methyltransferase [Thermodesulfobacteriota bacterium]